MNAKTVAKMLNLSQEKTTALEKAWNIASTVAAGVNSREDAVRVLAEKNIGDDILDKANSYLDNPLAGIAAQMTGINLDKIRSDINSLRNTDTSLQPVQQEDAQIDILKRGLQQLNELT